MKSSTDSKDVQNGQNIIMTANDDAFQARKEFALRCLNEIVVGSISGAIGKVVEFPFDTMKVRLQYSRSLPVPLFSSTFDCIQKTYTREGLYRGFYKGLFAPMIGASFEISTLFFGYKLGQDLINMYNDDDIDHELKIGGKIIAGGFAGILTSCVLTPIELVKVKYQVENLKNADVKRSMNPVVLIKSIIHQEGLRGMWKGWLMTAYKECGGGAAWFGLYETVLKKYKEMAKASPDFDASKPLELKSWQIMSAGGLAGIGYHCLMFPVDTVKNIIQSNDGPRIHVKDVIKNVYSKGGLRAFYSGFGVTVFKTIPSSGILFFSHEELKKYIKFV
ncbi:unnamed protein product [Ambrosiozyma monospora]|uniref:Unnamed protein product n=2 Tax=Ambrosiozyma monospora TaxID=43982 RepID=A0A9W6Z6G9_AMBMO|nr:unnamed protein product [Ambrosiozyma monospora]